MAKTFNQFMNKLDELYWPKAGDEAKFMAMHGNYDAADVGGPETHDDAMFKGTIVGKDESHASTDSETTPDGQSELRDLIKNIHSKDTDELLKTVAHLNLSTDPKHRESRDVINKELMYRYKNHSMSEELVGGQKNLDADGDKRLTAKDFAILRARKNKKKMNEELGFKPTKITIADHPEGYHAVAHGPNGQKKNVTQFPVGIDSARKAAADTAKEHGLKADKSKPYGHFNEDEELDEISDTLARNYERKADAQRRKLSNPYGHSPEDANTLRKRGEGKVSLVRRRFNKVLGKNQANEESELDEGKFGNALQRGIERYKDKSKSPLISAGIHALQTGSAARAANRYRKDTGNIEKFDDYAIKRRKVREEAEVDEAYGSGMKYYAPRRRGPATSPLDRPDVKQALNKPRVDNPAIKDIEDKIHAKFTPEYMKQAGDNAAAERKRQVDAEKKKRGIAESDTKSHKIAKAIMNKEEVNFNTEEIELGDGNVIEIDIELAEAIADLFDSLDEDDQDALAEMLHTDIDSFMEVVGLLENDGE